MLTYLLRELLKVTQNSNFEAAKIKFSSESNKSYTNKVIKNRSIINFNSGSGKLRTQ